MVVVAGLVDAIQEASRAVADLDAGLADGHLELKLRRLGGRFRLRGRQIELEDREPNETAVHEQEEHEDRHHVDHRHEVDGRLAVPLVMARHARATTYGWHRSVLSAKELVSSPLAAARRGRRSRRDGGGLVL